VFDGQPPVEIDNGDLVYPALVERDETPRFTASVCPEGLIVMGFS
jgi:hypothetical protein